MVDLAWPNSSTSELPRGISRRDIRVSSWNELTDLWRKENTERGKALGRLNVTDKDVATITNWIEDDAVTQDMYQERLDTILELGAQSDKDALASAGLSSAGQELMNIWNDLDRGAVKTDEAFEQADQAVRKRHAAKDGEM